MFWLPFQYCIHVTSSWPNWRIYYKLISWVTIYWLIPHPHTHTHIHPHIPNQIPCCEPFWGIVLAWIVCVCVHLNMWYMMDVDVACVWILVVKFFCILFSVEMWTSSAARTCRGILPPEVCMSMQTQSLSIFGLRESREMEWGGRVGEYSQEGVKLSDPRFSTQRTLGFKIAIYMPNGSFWC